MGAEELDIEPLDTTFGAVVRGAEIRSLDDATFDVVREAWVEHALLIFPGQFLTKDEQNAFARRFGELEFEAAPISNVAKDGTIHSAPDDEVVKAIRGNEGWHFDSTYMPIQAKGAVFTAETVPSSGAATGFIDMRDAYDELDPAEQERLAGMRAYHSLYYSQSRAGYLPERRVDGSYGRYGYHDLEPPLRPLVKVHPETSRPNLLIGRHAYGILGMAPQESEAFLDELTERVCRPSRMYHHQWEVGDAVVWDNRRLMHQATPFDLTEPRVMWHTRIAGDPTTETALNHQVPVV